MKLLAVLLLLGLFSPSVAEVVDSFKETCPQFFFKDKNNQAVTPTVFTNNKYKQICQFYKGEYRFATLYDTKHRIPVYSAYTYSTTDLRDISYKRWKIEPQLDLPRTNNNREMREEEQILNQALNKDYMDTSPNKADTSPKPKYTRGHVFPQSYAQGTQQKESTYTLTNAAPQIQEINKAWGDKVETEMLKDIKKDCDKKYLVYVVTGVVPGKTWLPIKQGEKAIEKRVNIPRYYWTAYSCKSKENLNINVSNGYIAEQIPDLSPDKLSIEQLNEELGKHYKTPFRVFG